MVSATSAWDKGQADAWNIKEKHEKDIKIICTHTTYVPVEQNHNFILELEVRCPTESSCVFAGFTFSEKLTNNGKVPTFRPSYNVLAAETHCSLCPRSSCSCWILLCRIRWDIRRDLLQMFAEKNQSQKNTVPLTVLQRLLLEVSPCFSRSLRIFTKSWVANGNAWGSSKCSKISCKSPDKSWMSS